MREVMRLHLDKAGGVAVQSANSTVFAEGKPVMCVGDLVAGHSIVLPHSAPSPMVEGSETVFIEGRAVCGSGHHASCGHAAESDSTVIIG